MLKLPYLNCSLFFANFFFINLFRTINLDGFMIIYLKDLLQLKVARLIKNRYHENQTLIQNQLDTIESVFEIISGLQDWN